MCVCDFVCVCVCVCVDVRECVCAFSPVCVCARISVFCFHTTSPDTGLYVSPYVTSSRNVAWSSVYLALLPSR